MYVFHIDFACINNKIDYNNCESQNLKAWRNCLTLLAKQCSRPNGNVP